VKVGNPNSMFEEGGRNPTALSRERERVCWLIN